jgi:hypothetical protein
MKSKRVGDKKKGGLLKALSALGPIVSLDVETDGLSPHECNLLCVGLSDGKRTVVIWPWHNRYAESLQRFLESREVVVCHNAIYDRTVLLRYGVG